MTRLKWENKPENIYINTKYPVLCGTDFLYATIDTIQLIWYIRKGGNMEDITIVDGHSSSVANAKKTVKQEFIKLGANFNDEIRNKGATKKLVIDK